MTTPTPSTTATQTDNNTLRTLNKTDTKPTTGDPMSDGSKIGVGLVDDVIQKKMKRAERFGMPVQLSEQEKRNSRAHRFGTVPATQGLDKKAQELKLKARAERFGITKSTPADEDEKKKARLARFASAANADTQEEQKKKARALRFSGSQVNASGKIESKTAITGKAGGEA
ncbi:hypothetical protein Tco_0989051 [Tanacetum coccineum]|uniref:THO1-MOS11 C-terminal domain-containing protein n=1 Tax=Tanacetum coccineum TaxID=301880 RepID=A0ABQ5EU23_9ASTR